MTFDPTALLDLWTRPRPDIAKAVEDFRRVYTDPVTVNGSALTAEDLVQRAIALQGAFADVHREILQVCDAGTSVALAFRLEGRHVGPLSTSAGVLPASGQRISLRVIDILTVTEGRISSIIMVADELGALAPLQLAALAT
jgi:predicted ester cyclase